MENINGTVPLEKAVFEVYYWQYADTDCFNNRLLDLFMQADSENKWRLGLAYPTLALALDQWTQAKDNGDELFRKYGLRVN